MKRSAGGALPASPSIAGRLGAVALLAALIGAASCTPEATVPSAHQKVLLVGIDGASFRVLDPLVAEGRLPVFESLLESGARGILRPEGAILSPPIWTSMVTGRSRSKHGIDGFFYPSEEGRELLVDSSRRKVSALWNWMGPMRRTVGFAGWWASWPAEEVNGWMITDRFARSQWSFWPGGREDRASVYPPDLESSLRPYLFDPLAPPLEELRALAEFDDEEIERLSTLAEPIPYDPISDLKFAYLAQRSYEEAVLSLLQVEQPDLTAIFLIANDPVCHSFWHFFEPAAFEGVEPEEVRRLGGLIPAFYAHLDRTLERFLSAVDPRTVVIIVSDHGFEASGDLSPSGDHDREGIFIAAGGPIAAGSRGEVRSVDIAPTVLRLMGLPIPQDLDGRVLEELFEPTFLERHPERTVPSFEPFFRPPGQPETAAPGDGEMRELLRSLGYLD